MAGVIPKATADLIKNFCMECESTDAVCIADKLMEMEAVRGMNKYMGCNLPVTLPVCKYTKGNSECQAGKCEFYIRRGYKKVTEF